jgi:acyl carrier protein
MTRQQVFEVVKQQIVETLDDVDESKIEVQASLKELGANSLDVVEVVSKSMRVLRVKLARSELVKLQNIGELVDLLHENAGAAELPFN